MHSKARNYMDVSEEFRVSDVVLPGK